MFSRWQRIAEQLVHFHRTEAASGHASYQTVSTAGVPFGVTSVSVDEERTWLDEPGCS